MKTRLIELLYGDNTELFEILVDSGAETGDLIYDTKEEKFHPVYMMGNTNICFTTAFQEGIHKVLYSSREKDNLPFP